MTDKIPGPGVRDAIKHIVTKTNQLSIDIKYPYK